MIRGALFKSNWYLFTAQLGNGMLGGSPTSNFNMVESQEEKSE